MLNLEIKRPNGEISHLETPDEVTIGKGASAEVKISGWMVSKEHARLLKTPSGVLLEDVGSLKGVYINGKRVNVQYGPLQEDDEIVIGNNVIKVKDDFPQKKSFKSTSEKSTSDTIEFRNKLANQELDKSYDKAREVQAEIQRDGLDGNKYKNAIVISQDEKIKKQEFIWRKKIHGMLIETMDLRREDISTLSDDALRVKTSKSLKSIIDKISDDIPLDLDKALLHRQVLNEAVGLGPLEELLADETVTEIMVNKFDEIYIERNGKLMRHSLTFTGDAAVLGVIERIVAPIGRRIDESSPMVDGRLKDGSRVNAIIPPLALKGPCLTIRKFTNKKLTADDLIKFDSIDRKMADFLEICVRYKKNIIVSGGTGSGKTTLLNILSNFIPFSERIVTVEDSAELKLHHDHLVSLESRPANAEGKGSVLIRDLVKNTLRMRPDRIVVGECRGMEALDMLQAMNTGHEGSLTTLHANTPRDALSRLETMVLMAGMDLPLVAIREQITSAVDIIVQQTRFSCGSRKVTSITEVTGMESGKVQMQEIFKYVKESYDKSSGKVNGYFSACNMIPSFYEELKESGENVDVSIFNPDRGSFNSDEELWGNEL